MVCVRMWAVIPVDPGSTNEHIHYIEKGRAGVGRRFVWTHTSSVFQKPRNHVEHYNNSRRSNSGSTAVFPVHDICAFKCSPGDNRSDFIKYSVYVVKPCSVTQHYNTAVCYSAELDRGTRFFTQSPTQSKPLLKLSPLGTVRIFGSPHAVLSSGDQETFSRFLTWGNSLFFQKRFHGGRGIWTHDQPPIHVFCRRRILWRSSSVGQKVKSWSIAFQSKPHDQYSDKIIRPTMMLLPPISTCDTHPEGEPWNTCQVFFVLCSLLFASICVFFFLLRKTVLFPCMRGRWAYFLRLLLPYCIFSGGYGVKLGSRKRKREGKPSFGFSYRLHEKVLRGRIVTRGNSCS